MVFPYTIEYNGESVLFQVVLKEDAFDLEETHLVITRMEKAVSAKNVLKIRIFKHWHYMNTKNYLHLT